MIKPNQIKERREKVLTILMGIVNKRLQSLIDEGDSRTTTYLNYNQVYEVGKRSGL